MKVSQLKYDDLTIECIDRILYEGIEDDYYLGDCILVLGSRSANKYRVPKAVKMYKENRAEVLLMSGGRILDDSVTEARMMRAAAVALGISENVILIEENSTSTKENMLCSLLTLERHFKLHNIRRLLLVTTRYHMRRSLLMAKAYMPSWIEIVPCPADDTNTLRHNWHLNERGFNRAKEEAYKVISYIQEGSIEDFDISYNRDVCVTDKGEQHEIDSNK